MYFTAVPSGALVLLACWLTALPKEAHAAFRSRNLHESPSGILAPALLEHGRSSQSIWPLNAFGTHSKEPTGEDPAHKRRVMDMINAFRAKICAKLHRDNGEVFDSFEKCLAFMTEVCKPGRDMTMDGDRTEVTTGKGYCTEFFHVAEKKAEAQVAKEEAAADAKAKEEGAAMKDKKEENKAPATAPAGASGPAPGASGAPPGVSASAPAPAPAAQKEASAAPVAAAKEEASAAAPAPAAEEKKAEEPPAASAAAPGAAAGAAAPAGAAAAPAGAAAAAAGAAGKGADGSAGGGAGSAAGGAEGAGGAGAGAASKGHDWYYNKDGINLKTRMHMDGSKGLPTHGFSGNLVGPHKDMATAMGDWQKETGCDDYTTCWKEICAKHPGSPWCEQAKTAAGHRSGSSTPNLAAVLIMLTIALIGRI